MGLIGELNSWPDYHLDIWFQPGEIQFINNYNVMHSGSAYEDDPDPALRRDLIRLWLTVDRDLDNPEIRRGSAQACPTRPRRAP